MNRRFLLSLALFSTLAAGLPPHHQQRGNIVPSQSIGVKAGPVRVQPEFGKVPLYFIPNRGQFSAQALFTARSSRSTL